VHANVLNSDINYEAEASWTTFPEKLEDHNVSWKIYQNEVSLPTGLTGEEESWLANFTDNSIEWFKQYNVRFSKGYRDYLTAMKHTLPADISRLTQEVAAESIQPEERVKNQTELGNKTAQLKNVQKELDLW